jgi:hypothetical protein
MVDEFIVETYFVREGYFCCGMDQKFPSEIMEINFGLCTLKKIRAFCLSI